MFVRRVPAMPPDRVRRLIVLAALASAGVFGCRRPTSAVPSTTARHPNGLVVTLPRTVEESGSAGPQPVSVERTTTGFTVFVARHELLRFTVSATVEVHTEGSSPPGSWPRQRTVRGQRVRYAIDEDGDAGSGGRSYTLRAWQACRGGYVLWRQSALAETFTPSFDLAWILIEGTEPPR
jgi:hypothetical protein